MFRHSSLALVLTLVLGLILVESQDEILGNARSTQRVEEHLMEEDKEEASNVTKTDVSRPLMTTIFAPSDDFKPIPGYCATKSSEVVDYDQKWSNGCLDLKGNLYTEGQFLMSCCGCFKVICNVSLSLGRPKPEFFWTKTLESECCQDCHGKVFTAGSVMSTEVLKDNCSTIVKTICVSTGQENEATAQMFYDYRNCCSDESPHLHPTGTHYPVPKNCSIRTCEREGGQSFAAWNLKQVLPGCNCCELPAICHRPPPVDCIVGGGQYGNLVEDRGNVTIINPPNKKRVLICCKGKFLKDIQPNEEI